MKILVFAHQLEVGGTQRNAIELSVGLRQQFGHDVVLFATPGPMADVAIAAGLRYLPAPTISGYPSLSMSTALRQVIRKEKPDVLHVWDWWQCVDAYPSAHLLSGLPIVVTDMCSERLTRLLPKLPITTFGTPCFVDRARALGWRQAELLLPPVDTHGNAPGVVDPSGFRTRHRITETDLVLVTVSRLVSNLKGESLRRTIQAIGRIGDRLPVRLLIAGDGKARPELAALAQATNQALGRDAVTLLGEMLDPRTAYAAADVVIGMGGSALRGMAFAKPVIVVGAGGFAVTMTPQSASSFLYKGIYGTDERPEDDDGLSALISGLAGSEHDRLALGEFSRRFVLEHFAIERVCARLDRYLRAAAAQQRNFLETAADTVRTFGLHIGAPLVPEVVRRLVRHREAARVRRYPPMTVPVHQSAFEEGVVPSNQAAASGGDEGPPLRGGA